MKKVTLRIPILFCLALVLPLAAKAQQAPPPPLYTYVAQWDVPRDKWPEISAYAEKNWRPLLERLVSDGTLADYGIVETIVHQVEGNTHSVWWTANSFAGIEKTRLEAIKVPPAPGMTGAKHSDLLLTSQVSKHRAATGSGYLRVNSVVVQPGKAAQWLAHWEKYTKPTFDELVANGTLTAYNVQTQYLAVMDPNTRFVVTIAPTAESVDKVTAALAAANQKRSADERAAIATALAQLVVPGANRGFMARITAHTLK